MHGKVIIQAAIATLAFCLLNSYVGFVAPAAKAA
jgi:hypothetical protein